MARLDKEVKTIKTCFAGSKTIESTTSFFLQRFLAWKEIVYVKIYIRRNIYLRFKIYFVELRFDEDERNLYFTFCAGKRKIRFQFYVPYGYPADPSPDERPLLMQEEGLYDVRF